MSTPTLVALLQALQKAEQFIAGFEDDKSQRATVEPLLQELRLELVLIPPSDAAAAFVHTPRPAQVSTGEHSHQRRYGNHAPRCHPRAVDCNSGSTGAALSMYRDGETDCADLELRIGLYTCARVDVRMRPDELREVARRMLDAAHDIEANPAAALAKAATGSPA